MVNHFGGMGKRQRHRNNTMAPRSRASVRMSATKSGGPELLPPEDSDSDEDLDEEVLRFRRGELDKLLKQKEKERVESA